MSTHPIVAKLIVTELPCSCSEQTHRIRCDDLFTQIKIVQHKGFITLTSTHDIACDISYVAQGSDDKHATGRVYVMLADMPVPLRNPPACRMADLWIEPIHRSPVTTNPSAVIKGLEDAIDYYSDFLELLVPYTKALCRRADEYASAPERIAERAAADKYWKRDDVGYVADTESRTHR